MASVYRAWWAGGPGWGGQRPGPTVRVMAASVAHQLIGPRHGALILYTSREGVAAQVGHDLTIEMTRWSGRLRVGRDPAASELTVTVDMGSMHIVEGTGGLAALSGGEKREILRNAKKILSVDRYPEATFVADKITADTLDGRLSLLGRTRRLRLAYWIDGGRHRVRGTIRQSDYGIKPFRAFFGALKLADGVRIEAELDIS
jgi:polyisoprenoid-binding protein YceI